MSTPEDASPALADIATLYERRYLVGTEVAASPDAGGNKDEETERRRTDCSLLGAALLRDGSPASYHQLTHKQPEGLRLTWDEFTEDHEAFKAVTDDPDSYWALRYRLSVHDSAKNPAIYDLVGIEHNAVDHDELLYRLICDDQYAAIRGQWLPNLDVSTEAGRLVRDMTRIKLKYAQLLQGEAPADPSQVIPEDIDPRALPLTLLEHRLDILGAAGNIDENTSLTYTSPARRRMLNLESVILDPTLPTIQQKNISFLDAEDEYFNIYPLTMGVERRRTVARLACHMRVNTFNDYLDILNSYLQQDPVSTAILEAELNRSYSTRATLPYYGPALLRQLTTTMGGIRGLTYYAHILQEAHIADKKARSEGIPGIHAVQLGNLVKLLGHSAVVNDPLPIRFIQKDGGLEPTTWMPPLRSIKHLETFDDGESFRGKRIVVVGEGGGSDVVQAKIVLDLLVAKFGAVPVAAISVRNPERRIEHGEGRIGQALQQIGPHTRPVGSWRYLEDIPLEGDNPVPTFILNSIDPKVIEQDMQAFLDEHHADIVIGVDTGGDSLYTREHGHFSAFLPTETTPDQDYLVIKGLASLARSRPQLRVLSTIVAPGIDAPPYAAAKLAEIGAKRLALERGDIAMIHQFLARSRMDGSGNQEGRYGKTPLAWRLALAKKFGFQVLHLPTGNVTDSDNPWRAYTYITEPNAAIVIAPMTNHYNAVARPHDAAAI